jgi:NADH dehydrogenase FAD-containing subunit
LEGTNTVLAPFDKPLQEEAIRRLQRETLFKDAKIRESVPVSYKPEELLLETQVKEITKDKILLGDGRALNYGMAVWAAGNGPLPITKDIIDSLGPMQEEQQSVTRGRIAIDAWLRVIGGEGKMLSLGDCACRPDQPLPSTAQVALQQGEYLALLLNKQFDLAPSQTNGVLAPPAKIPGVTKLGPSDWVASLSTGSSENFKPFQFFNLGILAYTGGNSALAQLTPVPDGPAIQSTGFWGNQIWRGVYLYKQLSWRNRFLIMGDWAKRKVFGRDITRLD